MTAERGGAALYTRDLLALAVSLADFSIDPAMPFVGEARSRTCGSSVAFACSVGDDGAIERIGLRASACAVGQAAAALFARHAAGRTRGEIASARAEIAAWLAGTGPLPDWPGLAAIAPALPFPARHGAIPLAWDAALAALPNAGADR